MNEKNPWGDGSGNLGGNPWAEASETSVFPLVTQEPPRRKRKWALPIVIILALIALVVGVGVVAIQTGWLNIKSPAAEEPRGEAEVVVSPVEENSSESGEAGDKADDDSDESDDGDNKDEESDQRHEAVEESDDDETKSSDAKQSRARSVASEEREFTVVRAGTSVTSDAFARQVHSAFVDYYESTGRTSGIIAAYSPVTQLYYSMECTDRGSYVVCTGGNNAVVYIS